MPWTSRKLAMTLLGVGTITALSYLGKLDATAATAIVTLVTGYNAANVTQKVVTDA